MKQNIFYKSFSLLAVVLLTLVATSCADTLFSKDITEDDEVQVTFMIDQSAPEMVLRGNNVNEPTAEEYEIQSMTIFAFDKSSGAFVNKAEVTPSDPNLIKINNLHYKYTTNNIVAGLDYVFVVVANVGNTFASFTGSLTELKATILTGSNLPSTPFVMYGETEVSDINNHTSIQINLKRVAFAVSVSSRAEGFQLENEWYLFNGETNGYLAKDPATGTITSNLVESGALTTSQKTYSYPRNATVTKTTETYVIFKGRYRGISSYYRVALNKKNNKQEFLSNRLYLLDIVKVVGVGYATLDEAKAAEADKTVVFTVSDWDDTNSSDAVFFGNYFISTERVFFEFDRALQQSSTIMRTNAPSLVLIPPVDRAKALDETNPEYEEATWATFSLVEAEPEEDPDVRVYRLNVGCFENNKGEREAFGYVRAAGIHSDDLKLRINILQRYDDEYYSDALSLNISPQLFFSNASSPGGEVFTSMVTLPIERQAWGIMEIEYFIPELGRYVSVGETDVMAQYPQYEFIESVSNASGQWEWKGTVAESVLFQVGDGQVTIRTKQMPAGPRHARVWLQTGRNLIFYNSIGVSQDFYGDYVITYPDDVHEDMKRSRYVIETPLTQTSPLEYYLDIESNSSWSIEVLPQAEGEDWVTVEPSSYDYNNDEGYGSELQTQRVKVTVQPNVSIPHMNADGVYEYPRARGKGLRITYRGNQKYENSNQYILILNEQIIDVYQGGYVTIGGVDWLDRNLKSGWRFSEERGGEENQGYPLLYPYANPLGLPVDKYGAYAKDNDFNASLGSRKYGDDGFFICAAEQSGYYNRFVSSYGIVYGGVTYYRFDEEQDIYKDKYASYYSYNFEPDQTGIDIYWDQLYAYTEENSQYPLNPCPPGWTVPYNENLLALTNAMTKGMTYGQPTAFPYNKYNLSYADGKMGVKNSGRMLYVANSEDGVGDVWELPFFLPAAGSRLLIFSSVDLSGTVGYYKQNEKHKKVNISSAQGNRNQSNAVLIVTQDKVLLGDQNTSEASSIRCVRKRPQP